MTTELQGAVEASAKATYESILGEFDTIDAVEHDSWEEAHPLVKQRFREQALEFILPAIPFIRIAVLRELGFEDQADEEELNLGL